MIDRPTRNSTRSCFIYDQNGDLLGQIRFQRDAHFRRWKVKYLTDSLPVNSFLTPQEIKNILLDKGYNWRWGEIRHASRGDEDD